MNQKPSKNSMYDSVALLTNDFFSAFVNSKVDDEKLPEFDKDFLNSIYLNSPTISLLYNHQSLGYEYFSPNIKDILGYSSEDFMKGGLKFAMSLVDPEHTKIYNRYILPLMFKYYSIYVFKNKIKDIRFSYTFKIKRKDEDYIWALHHMNSVETNKIGLPRLTIVHISDITEMKKDKNVDIIISRKEADGIFRPIYSKIFSDTKNHYSFSQRELEILTSIAQGKTSKQIANELDLSIHTINSHRRNMLEKSNLSNTTELIQIAIKKGLIMKGDYVYLQGDEAQN